MTQPIPYDPAKAEQIETEKRSRAKLRLTEAKLLGVGRGRDGGDVYKFRVPGRPVAVFDGDRLLSHGWRFGQWCIADAPGEFYVHARPAARISATFEPFSVGDDLGQTCKCGRVYQVVVGRIVCPCGEWLFGSSTGYYELYSKAIGQGDVVRLKSGGPAMVVTNREADSCRCAWAGGSGMTWAAAHSWFATSVRLNAPSGTSRAPSPARPIAVGSTV